MLLAGGAMVVGVRCRSWFLDVEGFELPKELALHATALMALWLVRRRLQWRSTGLVAMGFIAWSALACLAAGNGWAAGRALALTTSTIAVLLVAHTLALEGHRRLLLLVAAALTGWVAINVLLGAFATPGFDAAPLSWVRAFPAPATIATDAVPMSSGLMNAPSSPPPRPRRPVRQAKSPSSSQATHPRSAASAAQSDDARRASARGCPAAGSGHPPRRSAGG